jgi:aminopeptidase
VVEVRAARGEEMLRKLIETDPGSARLGEIALVPPVHRYRSRACSSTTRSSTKRREPRRPRIGLQLTMRGGDEMSEAASRPRAATSATTSTLIGSGELGIDGKAAGWILGTGDAQGMGG